MIVANHSEFRQFLTGYLLLLEQNYEISGMPGRVDEAIICLRASAPDIVLVEVDLPGILDYKEGKDTITDVNPRPSLANRLSISFPQLAKQFSQEFQLLYSGDRLNWVVGAYYLNDDQSATRFAKQAPA